jgi:polyphosphate kinase
VEVITPVDHPAARARLDHILELQLADPNAWQLQSDGSYTRDSDAGDPERGSQQRLIAEIDERPPQRGP